MANPHAEVIDTLDEANSTATISLTGLGLFCFNEQGAFEGGFVRRPTHNYMIEIKESGAAGSSPRLRITGLDGDVDISVLNPIRAGSRRYQRGDFDRKSETNDPRDFRWVVDMEGPEMHDEPLSPTDTRPPEGGANQLSRLNISAGTFYAKRLSQDTYARVRKDSQTEESIYFGAIAEDVGAEIECADEEGSGVLITISSGATTQQVFLPRISGLKYDILFRNDCPEVDGPRPEESDFHIFYDVVRDSGGKRFDLANAVDPDDPRAAGGVLLDDAPRPKFKDRYGLVCNKVYLGRSSTLSHLS